MPEVGRKMKLWRYEVGGWGELALETIKKKREERETAIHCTKWLYWQSICYQSSDRSGRAFDIITAQRWSGKSTFLLSLPSIPPAICLSVHQEGGCAGGADAPEQRLSGTAEYERRGAERWGKVEEMMSGVSTLADVMMSCIYLVPTGDAYLENEIWQLFNCTRLISVVYE